MPEALSLACPHLGCRETQPCATHERIREQRRGTAHQRGYDRAWQAASRRFLKRYPLCGMRAGTSPPVMSRCHDQGMVTAAAVVDHIIPHRGNRKRFNDRANWQSMCLTCHGRKTQAGL